MMGSQFGSGSILKVLDSWWLRVPTSLLSPTPPPAPTFPLLSLRSTPGLVLESLAWMEVFLSRLVWRGLLASRAQFWMQTVSLECALKLHSPVGGFCHLLLRLPGQGDWLLWPGLLRFSLGKYLGLWTQHKQCLNLQVVRGLHGFTWSSCKTLKTADSGTLHYWLPPLLLRCQSSQDGNIETTQQTE